MPQAVCSHTAPCLAKHLVDVRTARGPKVEKMHRCVRPAGRSFTVEPLEQTKDVDWHLLGWLRCRRTSHAAPVVRPRVEWIRLDADLNDRSLRHIVEVQIRTKVEHDDVEFL